MSRRIFLEITRFLVLSLRARFSGRSNPVFKLFFWIAAVSRLGGIPRNDRNYWFFVGVFLWGMIFCSPLLVSADKQGGFTISPAFQEVVLDQTEKEKDFFVAITNTTEALATIRISILDFGSLDESGGVAFLGASGDLEKKYSLASWMRPEKDVLTLASGETGKIRVTIENRESLSPGGHYAALAFEAANVSDSVGVAENSVAVKQLFSTLVFVKKIGGEIYDLRLNGQEYENNILKLPDVVRLRFQNSGNTHLAPRGIITITDSFHRVVAKGTINQESTLILPETLRVYPTRFNALAVKFIPGRYTMRIAYRYDGKDDFTTTSLQFDFIPPVAIVVFLLLVAIGWYVARYWRQRGEKRAFSSSNKGV